METTVEKEQLKAVVWEAIISVLEDDVYRSRAAARALRAFALGLPGSERAVAARRRGRNICPGMQAPLVRVRS